MKKHPNSIVFRFAAILFLLTGLVASAAVDRYVIKDHAGGDGEYLGWGTAAPDIQAAIDAADADDTIWVTNGVYDTGGRVVGSDNITNRVVIDKAVTVRSVEGPDATIIKGAKDPADPAGNGGGAGPAAVRGVYLDGGAQLFGFTVTNGASSTVTSTSATRDRNNRGGGIFLGGTSGIVISNCVVSGNYGHYYGGGITTPWRSSYGDIATVYDTVVRGNRNGTYYGGGVYAPGSQFYRCSFLENQGSSGGNGGAYGTYTECFFANNFGGSFGGGAFYATLYDCIVSNNIATYTDGGGGMRGGMAYDTLFIDNEVGSNRKGGGASGSTLYRCTLTGNTAGYGGGVYESTLYQCVVTNNTAVLYGGAARGSTLYNCLVAGNESVRQGGGGYYSTFYNCTVVGNDSTSSSYGGGGGMYGGMAVNSIVYFNDTAASGPNYDGTVFFTNSLTYPAQAGWAAGNLTNAPVFLASGSGYGLDHQPGDYRLNSGSPGLNAGMEFAWMSAPEFAGDIRTQDLDGNPRIDKAHGIVDMGAYERTVAYGTLLLVQ